MSTVKTAKAATTPSANGVKQIEEAVAVHKEAIESVVNAGSAAFKGYEDILQFNRDNVDALVKSGGIVARGMQDLSRSFVSLTQESIDESVAAGKALFGAKTFKEVMDLSTSMAKSNFDKLVAEGTRFGQLSAKLAEEAFAPLNGRIDAAVQQFTRPML